MSDELEWPDVAAAGADFDVPADVFRAAEESKPVKLLRSAANGDVHVDNVAVGMDREREIFEGDIDLTPVENANPHMLGLSIRHGYGQWPNGILYCVVEDILLPVVTAAVKHWMAMTPLRFERGVGNGDYLSFEDRGVCRSVIGRVGGGAQVVELQQGCTAGAVVHEIGHAVGLWHEQSRNDRDHFVDILWQNIAEADRFNFDFQDGSAVNQGPYDLQSVMHYPSNAFSNNGRPTIVTKDGSLLPPRQGLSLGDIATVRALYPTLNWN